MYAPRSVLFVEIFQNFYATSKQDNFSFFAEVFFILCEQQQTNGYKGKIKKYPPDVVAKFCVETPHPVGIFMLILSLYFQSPYIRRHTNNIRHT